MTQSEHPRLRCVGRLQLSARAALSLSAAPAAAQLQSGRVALDNLWKGVVAVGFGVLQESLLVRLRLSHRWCLLAGCSCFRVKFTTPSVRPLLLPQ